MKRYIKASYESDMLGYTFEDLFDEICSDVTVVYGEDPSAEEVLEHIMEFITSEFDQQNWYNIASEYVKKNYQ